MSKPFNEHGTKTAIFKNKGDEALHGDVILTATDLPENFKEMPLVKDACLAHGEATGHHHKIVGRENSFELRECPKTKMKHLRVIETVSLKHQEHSPIVLPPGGYKVGVQREYDPFSRLIRTVAD